MLYIFPLLSTVTLPYGPAAVAEAVESMPDLSFALGGGGDIAFHQKGNFALRGQAEYFGIRANGGTTPSSRLSGGIVYRFARKRSPQLNHG